jgi:hypothetical protein
MLDFKKLDSPFNKLFKFVMTPLITYLLVLALTVFSCLLASPKVAAAVSRYTRKHLLKPLCQISTGRFLLQPLECGQ